MPPVVKIQEAMKRSAKKPGATPPAKKATKTTPVKTEPQPVVAGAESVPVAKIEPEVKPLAAETAKPAIDTAQDTKPRTEGKDESRVDLSQRDEKAAKEDVQTIKTAFSEANGDGKKITSATSAAAAAEKTNETVARAIKVTASDSAKKRKKVVASSETEGGHNPAQSNEAVTLLGVEKEKQQAGNADSDKKDWDYDKSETVHSGSKAKLITEIGLEVARDEQMEDSVEEDNEEEAGEEDQVEGYMDEIEGGEDENEEGGEDGDEVEGNEEEAEEGDEVEEHPELQEPRAVTERQKRKKLEVFVGGLDKDAAEDDVKKAFEQVGEVVEVRLMRNPITGKNKGYAFVRFGNADQATRAATEMKRTQIRGKLCGVVPSDDNDVLFLGNINRTWKKEQVEEKLKEYGIDGIEELTLMGDPRNEGTNRGYAFLELATHNAAIKAHQRLQKPDAIFGFDRSAKVAWAEPQNEPDDEVMSQVKSVFVDGMPVTWSEEKARERFGKFGEIERIVLARNMPTARRKDFAFVNFAKRESAIACLDAFKDTDLIDGDSKVKVKVTLAKPTPKIKPKAVKGEIYGDHLIGYPQLRGSRGPLNYNMDFRRPGRGGRGFTRGGNRVPGRYMKWPYDDADDYDDASVHRLLRALRHVAEEDRYAAERSRSRSRWSPGPPPRPSRGSRGGYSRREEMHPRPAYSNRPSYEYRSSSRRDFRDTYPRQSSARQSSRPSRPPPRDDGYSRRVDHVVHDYDRGTYRAGDYSGRGAGDYSEPSPGIKRPFSSMDDTPGYYDSGARGYQRARMDHGDAPPPPPPQYDSVRSPLRHSGPGRTPMPPISGGTVAQASLGSYNHQPGGLGGPSYQSAGSSSLYGSGSHGYRSSVLSGASDYISSSAGEMRGGSLYGSGYNLSGDGSGSYY